MRTSEYSANCTLAASVEAKKYNPNSYKEYSAARKTQLAALETKTGLRRLLSWIL